MRNLRLLINVQSHTSLPPSGMEGHSWTAYFVKGVYTAQPRLVCNSYVAVVVPQVLYLLLVELSSVLCEVCDYSVMSKVTRAYPLLVWGVTLGLPTP